MAIWRCRTANSPVLYCPLLLETDSQGTNLLVGTDPGKIVAAARDVLGGKGKPGRIPPLWDGHAAQRIVEILLKSVPRGNSP